MTEMQGELWDYYGQPNTIVLITTNGDVTNNGKAVMGRGCALEAKKRFPGIDSTLGQKLQAHGNVMHWLQEGRIYTFPVKHHWSEDADPLLIANSAMRLAPLALHGHDTRYILPRPGCGNGRLSWQDVKPLIAFLPDNVIVIHK